MKTNVSMIRLIADDLGARRAVVLVSDALSGEDADILRLERLAHVKAYRSRAGDGPLLISKKVGDAWWSGDRLVVRGAVPDSVAAGVVGLPLGSVVDGAGLEDDVITQVTTCIPMGPPEHNPATTSFYIDDQLVGPEDLPLGRTDLVMRPVRRTLGRLHLAWHGQREERLDMVTRDSLPETIVLVALMLFMSILVLPLISLVMLFDAATNTRLRRVRRRRAASSPHRAMPAEA